MAIPSTITDGSADTLQGSIVSFNPDFLLEALATFTGDSVTLHLREMEDGQTVKPVLLTAVALFTRTDSRWSPLREALERLAGIALLVSLDRRRGTRSPRASPAISSLPEAIADVAGPLALGDSRG
jgi:hypothetical protein